MTQSVAIIGGGISGLTVAHLLNDKYDITLFEKDNTLGGNMCTINTREGDEIDVSVFCYAKDSYPNFYKLLSRIGIEPDTKPLDGLSMTMHNLDTGIDLYFNPSIKNVVKRLSNYNRHMVKAGTGAAFFLFQGLRQYKRGEFDGLTLKEALDILPQTRGDALKAAIFPICLASSMYWDDLMDAPAEFFFGKIHTHFGSPRKAASWRLINYRTKVYINKLSASFQHKVKFNSNIKSVARSEQGITLNMADGKKSQFDKVIFACNADQALNLIEHPTDKEQKLLGTWKYKDGLVVVHKDDSSFPHKNKWSLYDFLYSEKNGKVHTSINACYCHQKSVSGKCKYLGTQHPNFPINEELIEFRKVFRTPIFNTDAMQTIEKLPELNVNMHSYFCGSHFGHGLHEDAITSAIQVSKTLGADWS